MRMTLPASRPPHPRLRQPQLSHQLRPHRHSLQLLHQRLSRPRRPLPLPPALALAMTLVMMMMISLLSSLLPLRLHQHRHWLRPRSPSCLPPQLLTSLQRVQSKPMPSPLPLCSAPQSLSPLHWPQLQHQPVMTKTPSLQPSGTCHRHRPQRRHLPRLPRRLVSSRRAATLTSLTSISRPPPRRMAKMATGMTMSSLPSSRRLRRSLLGVAVLWAR